MPSHEKWRILENLSKEKWIKIHTHALSAIVLTRHANTIQRHIAVTFYSQTCLGQETAKGPFDLRVKLPPARLSTTHDGGFTYIAQRKAEKLWIPIFKVFGLTRPGIEHEFTVSVDALFIRLLNINMHTLTIEHTSCNTGNTGTSFCCR